VTGTDALRVNMGVRSWTFERDTPVCIGRGAECDVVVDDPLLSRRHVRIEFRGGWVVEDAGSRHGTWLDGRRLRTHRLAGPVVLRLGDRRSGPAVTVEVTAGGPVPGAGTLTLGRARDNDIVLNDVQVSRHHARVETTAAGRRRVVDLGSRNRTLVNGTVADPALPLADGDRLTIGNTEFAVDGAGLRPTTVTQRRLIVDDVGYELPKVGPIVAGVGFEAGPGELVAVIGPSGAGKSTLLKLLTGELRPSAGTVSYDGYDAYDQFDAVRLMIGVVPQDDVVHRRLTVRQALGFAARLRLPDDATRDERRVTIDGVLAELGLTEHAGTRVDRLSGGQRKRVSIALELLTSPSLLLLDEPTSGLDPALDRHVMQTLRTLADGGRTVLVVTHNLAHLGACDRVLLLAPGGLPVYFGSPAGVLPHFGVTGWADVFARVIEDPAGAHHGFTPPAGGRRVRPAGGPGRTAPVGRASRATRLRQARTVAARHAVLIAADRPYALFLLLLPMLLAALVLIVPGHTGLLPAGADAPGEPGQILVLLVVGAAFAGGAVSAREVIGERAIVVRERAAGLLPGAYALAKLVVFGAVCAVQAVVLTVGCALARPVPTGGVLLGSGKAELAIALWATALASCQLSLLGSAIVRSAEQVMPALVVTVMAQLVLCGGLIPVTGRTVVSQLSWFLPARWGYAAAAATVDLRALSPGTQPDALWRHAPGPWLLSVTVLLVSAVGLTLLVRVRLSRIHRS
jgi:ABC transport system ATP-binding/permease protein